MQVVQRLYLLSLLQSSGLQRSSLHLLFSALVTNKLTYAVLRMLVNLLPMTKTGLRKAMRQSSYVFYQFILHVLCFVFYILCISLIFYLVTVCDCHTE